MKQLHLYTSRGSEVDWDVDLFVSLWHVSINYTLRCNPLLHYNNITWTRVTNGSL